MATTETRWQHVLDLVDVAAERRGAEVAVSETGLQLTYAELGARADVLALTLRDLAIGPGDLVGLDVPRSAAMVVGALGILRAGAAYVAIDPSYPPDRVRWMLADAQVSAVVVAQTGPQAGPVGAPVLMLDGAGRLAGGGGPVAEELPGPADGAAYVVYTSGSTGRPKGVVIEHASLANLVEWHGTAFGLDGHSRCTQIASPGFDASAWEIWPTLAAGAELQIVPERLRTDPAGLRDWLVANGTTVSFLPTALAEAVIALEWPAGGALRHLLTGGDVLTRRPRGDLPFTVVNNYGVSEATVVSTSGEVKSSGGGLPLLGRPIAGVEVQVVDEHLNPVPVGGVGEIVITGASVGRGYLNRPELTAERFVEDDGERRYRTGDLGRLTSAGELEFLGRIDDQLSIRGFRVEPGEVAAALGRHPAVRGASVEGAGEPGAARSLVGCLVAAGAERPSAEELTRFLTATLPDHMCPSRYLWIDALPLGAHGKVDRAALRELIARDGGQDKPDASPARAGDVAGVERRVAAIVAELLSVDSVGAEENFFLLGGHSMLGAQLIVRLEDDYGAEVSLRYLFDHPTPAEIAREVARQVRSAPPHGAGE